MMLAIQLAARLRFGLPSILVVMGTAHEAAAAEPLSLPEVLESVDATHPDLEGARLDVEAAQGKAFAARGGWDPKLSVSSKWAPVGYYDTTTLDTSIRQATPVWGAAVYAGYRLGWGNFPVYKGDLETRRAGELRAGIEVPLWRDGPIDARRAKISRTKLERQGAQAGVDAERLSVHRKAARAYWTWVAAGRRVRVAEGLLELARARQKALDAQVAAGSIEAIKRVDNERLVLSREAKLVAERRKFDKAAIDLSLHYRDRDQQPVRASLARVPESLPTPHPPDEKRLLRDIEQAQGQHPKLAQLAAEREANGVDVKLAKNRRAPEAKLHSFVSRDLGGGPDELAPTDWGVAIVFSVPIPLRKARGDLQAAKAKLAKVDAKTRGARDAIAAKIRKAHVDVVAARRTARLAEAQVGVASTLADAERKRFEGGASDLVVVNLRELAVADAQAEAIDASASYHGAIADYRVAIGRPLIDG